MNKLNLKSELIHMQKMIVSEFEGQMKSAHSMVDIDESDVMDPEDFSHQYEAGEMEQLMRTQMNRAKSCIDLINNIDFSPKSKIEVGAIVETGAFAFFIGIPTTPFNFEGRQIVGISKEAPFYTVLIDKKVGDHFTYCGNEYTIDAIY